MINKKYQHYIFGLMMAVFMSGIMSMVVTLQTLGFIDDLLLVWLKAWFFTFITAFPVALLISPIIKNLVSLVIREPVS